MEAMAMGLSTQTTAPFVSSSQHFFWSSTPRLRSSSMASHSSRRSFRSSSRKALHRRQECVAPSAACQSTSKVVFSPFQTARCSTSYTHRQVDMTCIQSTGWKLEVPVKGINDSPDVAHMRPALYSPFSSKESSFTRGFRGLQRVEDETKQVDVKRLPQSGEWKLQLPTAGIKTSPKVARMHADVGNQLSSGENSFSRGFSGPQRVVDGIRQGEPDRSGPSSAVGNCWLEETEKLRAAKLACNTNVYSSRDTGIPSARTTNMVLQSLQQGSRDGYACDGGELDTPVLGRVNGDKTNLDGNMRLDHIRRSESSDIIEGSASFRPGLVGKNLTSRISVYAEGNQAERDKEYMNFPSKQYSNSSLNSNTRVMRNPNVIGYSKADPSTPTRKQQNKDSDNKGHDGINGGHDSYNPSFSGQNYWKRTNMSNSYAGGPTRYYPKEYNQVDVQPKSLSHEALLEQLKEASAGNINGATQNDATEGVVVTGVALKPTTVPQSDCRGRLLQIYDKVLIVDNISMAMNIVEKLTTQYRHCVHACDTEVANIDVKQETPVAHGEITCFSIYSGPEANFGDGKSCIWVDVLDGGGKNLLDVFAPFFEDPSIKKVWHNYSFDRHIIENYGFKVSGFHADTMHMARLWDSSRRTEGGYSLEALSGDPKVCPDKNLIGKISMKTIFGKRKLKKDGSEGKVVTIPAVEELQREDRKAWICYSALDSMSTLNLYESLKSKLSLMEWQLDSVIKGSMLDFYEEYWRPFGELLVDMEAEGMLVDRAYLAEIEKVAQAEQQVASNRFRGWASKYSPDAKYMNIGSDTQLRQLFFGGIQNSKNPDESLPEEKEFKIPNVEKVIAEGKKTATKFRTIKLRNLVPAMETELYTDSGWPSLSGAALKTLAGKVSAEFDYTDETQLQSDENLTDLLEKKPSAKKIKVSRKDTDSDYGTAYDAFGGGQRGKEACHAIAALCEVCSIDSLISNFILPLQGSHISGKNGRIHCSLNINTETGRLSARRPNLQNQPALEKDRYKIRQAFIAAPGNSLIVADYGQLELRILAHLANCKSMLDAFKAGGDFHSRTAMNMYPHIREAVEKKKVLLEWDPQPGEEKPPVPLLKDAFASERRKAKMLNFSIAYGKTPVGLARDWKVSVKEAKETVQRWYSDRKEVLDWQKKRQSEARRFGRVHTLLGRARTFPSVLNATPSHKGHIDRAAINTPVQGSAADVAMCAMLRISEDARLKELGWKLLLQVHDEVILEGPTESAEEAKAIVIECMSKPFEGGKNILKVDLSVDSKIAGNWYAAK